MGAGSIGVLAHVQVQHHALVWVGDAGRVPPGVLGVEQQGVLGLLHQGGLVFFQVGVQAAGQLVVAAGGQVVLDRVGRGAHAVGPPVVEVPAVHRRVGQLGGDGRVQLLQADHAHGHVVAVAAVVVLDRVQDQGFGRGVVAEHARHRRQDEVVGVAVFLTFAQVVVQVLGQGLHVVGRPGGAAQAVHGHKVGGVVGPQAQHVAQVVVFAVPHQQAAAVLVLPEIGGLVAAQRVHAVVAVDVGVQEPDAVFDQGVPLTHGKAVDVGAHGRVQVHPALGEAVPPGSQTAGIDPAVQKVGEVQVVGRQADAPLLGQGQELGLFFGRGGVEEFLHAEQGLAVPAEIGVFGALHQAQGAADVVHLQVDDVLLQVGVPDVGVGMVDGIDRPDGMLFHRRTSPAGSSVQMLGGFSHKKAAAGPGGGKQRLILRNSVRSKAAARLPLLLFSPARAKRRPSS